MTNDAATPLDLAGLISSRDTSSVDVTLSRHSVAPPRGKDKVTTAHFGQLGDEQATTPASLGGQVKLSQGRKWLLLLIFAVAQFLDLCSWVGLQVLTEIVLTDLDIKYESSSWVITAYSVTFASFLLLWGRIADLYSAKPVFVIGFLGLGVFNLVISFMPDQYSYFVMRALSGVFAAATIPAAFRLILDIFEPEELNTALTLFGSAGTLAASCGLIIAGFFGFITAHDQNASWRWFFRMFPVIIAPFGILAWVLIPPTQGCHAEKYTNEEKFKRLDLVGCFMMFVTIVLLTLGLTLGATYGYRTAKFLVPFVLTWPFLVAFFIWEARLPHGYALIPPSFWRIPNIPLLMWFALAVYLFWGLLQLALSEICISVFGESPIIAAVRMMPLAVASGAGAFAVPIVLKRTANRGSKWFMAGGATLAACAYILIIYTPDGGNIKNGDNNYWKYWFPAFTFGSIAMMSAFIATQVTVMTSIPPEMAAVSGAILQVCLQIGAVIGLSVQAGFFTIKPGAFANWYNVQASLWFQAGWYFLNALLVVIFFRKWQTAAQQSATVAL